MEITKNCKTCIVREKCTEIKVIVDKFESLSMVCPIKDEKKEWWFCNKNGIMVYDQMCYDCCFIDEIRECLDVRDKPQKRRGL